MKPLRLRPLGALAAWLSAVVYTRGMGEAVPSMSYAEYVAYARTAETKHEFADGVVLAMAGGTPEHARLAGRLIHALVAALTGRPCNVLTSDARVRVEATNRATYPDLSVVCGPIETAEDDPQGITNPTVIVEVLSPGTEGDDRGPKFRHYRRLPSLQEFVLVAQDERSIEIYRREADVWTLREYGPGDVAALTSLGVRLAVDEIYADPAG